MREAALNCRAREKIKMEWKTRALEHDVDGDGVTPLCLLTCKQNILTEIATPKGFYDDFQKGERIVEPSQDNRKICPYFTEAEGICLEENGDVTEMTYQQRRTHVYNCRNKYRKENGFIPCSHAVFGKEETKTGNSHDDGDVVFVDNDDYNKKKQSGGKRGNQTPAATTTTTNMKKAKPCTTKKGTDYCSHSSDSSDDDNISDVWCDHCRIGGELLKCEGGCAKSYHAACVAANPNDLPDPWLCPNCIYVQRANDMADLPPSNLAGETILLSAFYCSAISMYSHLSSFMAQESNLK